MSLIYITGQTGSGKTTIRTILRERGYEAHDTDEDGIAIHADRITGLPIEYPTDPLDRTEEFWSKQAFNLVPERIAELAHSAEEQTIFLCGAASNDTVLAAQFDLVICLYADIEETKQRVATRTTNDYGKAPDELAKILARHDAIPTKYGQAGAIIMPSEGTPDEMVDRILLLVDSRGL